jgi:hypothetical protein
MYKVLRSMFKRFEIKVEKIWDQGLKDLGSMFKSSANDVNKFWGAMLKKIWDQWSKVLWNGLPGFFVVGQRSNFFNDLTNQTNR